VKVILYLEELFYSQPKPNYFAADEQSTNYKI
jgi:hypothetical protein